MSITQRVSYQDVKARILASIHDNTWPPGSILPGEVDLAEKFGCARATVNRAMRELTEDGIIERKRKAGTRVKLAPSRPAKLSIPIIREEIEKNGAAYRYALIDRQERAAPAWLAAKLGLSQDAPAIHLKCLHFADGDPYQFEERWINLATVPAAREADFSSLGPNEWLLNEVPFTELDLSFIAVSASPEIADFLGTHAGAALMSSERTTWLQGDNVTFAKLIFGPGYRLKTAV